MVPLLLVDQLLEIKVLVKIVVKNRHLIAPQVMLYIIPSFVRGKGVARW